LTGPSTAFDRTLLDELSRRREVGIKTVRPDGTTRHVMIWVVVVDDEVYVRSWKGDRGYWYQAALDAPDEVWLIVGDRTVPVVARPAGDEQSIERCSEGLQRKYGRSRSVDSMLVPDILHATMRLEPRSEEQDHR
jgi:hypothetical protein